MQFRLGISNMDFRPFKAALSMACLSLASIVVSQSVLSQESEVENVVNISALTCRELLLMNGEDRQSTIVFVQGYLSGQNSEIEIDTEQLRAASDTSLEQCIDEPDASILTIFEQNR